VIVDIGVIVEHHYLNFIFTSLLNNQIRQVLPSVVLYCRLLWILLWHSF